MQKLGIYSTRTHLHADTNPGAPGRGSGPSWPPGLHDDLKLPSGRTIGETDTDSLRHEFARLGVAEAQTAGRHILCQRYAELLAAIGEAASEKAIAEFLESKRV
jgi:hypothetical protein